MSDRAEKQLRRISKLKQIVIASRLKTLNGGEKLVGYKNIYRVRIGDYRVVYRRLVNEIYVVLIGHRKEIYELLDRLLR